MFVIKTCKTVKIHTDMTPCSAERADSLALTAERLTRKKLDQAAVFCSCHIPNVCVEITVNLDTERVHHEVDACCKFREEQTSSALNVISRAKGGV